MARTILVALVLAAFALSQAVTGQQKPGGVAADLLTDINDAESKITSLAKALPDAAWNWRPGPGVRSSGEVIVHIAADNYFAPAALGIAVPADTGIDIKRFETIGAYEKRQRTRAQAMADMAASFAFMKQHVGAASDAQLAETVSGPGRPATRRAMWLGATTHLHEHLGQLIAYARSNKVVPPWSR